MTVLPVNGWRTSSRCGPNGGNCVEVNHSTGRIVGVRDTKPADSAVLLFSPSSWRSFVAATTDGNLQA